MSKTTHIKKTLLFLNNFQIYLSHKQTTDYEQRL